MLIINRDSVNATRQKIADPKKISQAIKDVKKMLYCGGLKGWLPAAAL
jgi:hypothetical protein